MFTNSAAWKDLPDIANETDDVLLDILYDRLATATREAVATYTITKYFPKPWWCDELREARNRRERAFLSSEGASHQ